MSQTNDQPVRSGPGAGPPYPPADTASPDSSANQRVDITLPPENQELFHAIVEVANNPEADRIRLYAAMLGATFLVPLAKEVAPPDPSAGSGEVNIDVLTLTGAEGELALPVFTHEDAVRAWASPEAPVPPTLNFPGLSVFQLAASSPMQFILINPAGPFGGQVSRAEFEALAQEMLPEVAAMQPAPMDGGRQNVLVDSLLEPLSEATQDRLREILEENFAVQGAYLFLMQVGEAESPRLALGLDVEGAAGQWVIPQMSRLFALESLSFEPYGMPELLLLEQIPGSESVRQTIQPLFFREGSGAASQQTGESAADSAGEEPLSSDAVDADEREYGASPAEVPVGSDDEDAPSAPRRRALWPFRRQR